ncbi:hypothetical protein [Streptomyces sp. NPDC060027]
MRPPGAVIGQDPVDDPLVERPDGDCTVVEFAIRQGLGKGS